MGGRLETTQGAREPLGYVALPVFQFYLWQDVLFVVMASFSDLFDFKSTVPH